MRAIVFRGHKEEKDSMFVTQLFAGFESVTKLWDFECSLRTVSNLDNLYVVRGVLDARSGRLRFETSMTGPHHYFGYMDPFKCYRIRVLQNTQSNYQVHAEEVFICTQERHTITVPSLLTCDLSSDDFEWSSHSLQTDADVSLFSSPGTLRLKRNDIHIPTIQNPQCFNWSSFGAQLIAPNQAFSFKDIQFNRAAHHRLRLVTYHYGNKYFEEFCRLHHSDFLERHDFLQFVHALAKDCGGSMILGRNTRDGRLQLVQFKIPVGYTLLLHAGCLHGDARLTGLYLMGMTGNHQAMQTADTVFFRNAHVHHDSTQTQMSSFEPLMTHHGTDAKTLLQKLKQHKIDMRHRAQQKQSLSSMFWKPLIVDPFGNFRNVSSTGTDASSFFM